MTTDLKLLAAATLLTWLMLVVASLMRTHGWTPTGLRLAFGNRDDLDAPSPATARADRAAKNMLENLILFAALVLTAHAGGTATAAATAPRVVLGAHIFFWARVAYWPVYLAGIRYLRTMIWLVSLVGLALIASTLLP